MLINRVSGSCKELSIRNLELTSGLYSTYKFASKIKRHENTFSRR